MSDDSGSSSPSNNQSSSPITTTLDSAISTVKNSFRTHSEASNHFSKVILVSPLPHSEYLIVSSSGCSWKAGTSKDSFDTRKILCSVEEESPVRYAAII